MRRWKEGRRKGGQEGGGGKEGEGSGRGEGRSVKEGERGTEGRRKEGRERKERRHVHHYINVTQSTRQGKVKQVRLKATPLFSREKEELPQAEFEPTTFYMCMY